MFQIFHEFYVLIRLAGIHFFGLFGRAGVEVLIEGLNESDERIVKLAEDKLKRMGSKAMPALIKALNSKNTLIQSRSAKLLGMRKTGWAQRFCYGVSYGYLLRYGKRELTSRPPGAIHCSGEKMYPRFCEGGRECSTWRRA